MLQQVFGHFGNRLLVVAIGLLLLSGLALWMYEGMKQSTESIAASDLQTILNADVKALELWIEEKKKDVRLWSSRAEIRQAVNELARIAERESEPTEELLAARALTGLRTVLEKFDRIAGRPEQDAVVTRDGLFLAAGRDETIGTRLNTDGIAALVPVFQGRTLFIKPHPNGAFGVELVPDLNVPVVYVVAPIRRGDSDDSEVVAAAGFGFPADDEFTQILSVARQGQTGETYTFDENGLLLSESRFEREVQLASGLTHPNTIDIFDFGRTPEGSFYCVMEFLNGRTLENVIRSEGPLAADRAANLLRQIAGSLNEAHRRGLVHRDIKPSNIMLCEQGGIPDFVKVLDFGLARTVERLDGKEVTQAGLVVGTPSYLAPERLTDPATVDQRSDLYSFGAVGHYLLTGRHIYDAARAGDLLRQILNEIPPRPSEVTGKEIPRGLEELIVRCLERSPQDRPATMQEVMTSITQISVSLAQGNIGI